MFEGKIQPLEHPRIRTMQPWCEQLIIKSCCCYETLKVQMIFILFLILLNYISQQLSPDKVHVRITMSDKLK